MKKEIALVVINVLGSIHTRKKEQVLFVHPLRDLVKETERNLVDEINEKGKVKMVVDAQSLDRNLLQSLIEARRLQVRKTGKHAETTFLDPALVGASAITGIHWYVETGVPEPALMIKSAHSSIRKSLSKHAALNRNRKLKQKRQLPWPS